MGSKNTKHLTGSTQAIIHPLIGHYTDRSPMDLGQYDVRGEYCGPHTASSVSHISILNLKMFYEFSKSLTDNMGINLCFCIYFIPSCRPENKLLCGIYYLIMYLTP